MPKTLNEVTRDAAALSVDDRLKLARILLESADQATEPVVEVETAWEEEIERRLSEIRAGKVTGVPLAEVKRRIEASFTCGH